jgi:hypothetical protein
VGHPISIVLVLVVVLVLEKLCLVLEKLCFSQGSCKLEDLDLLGRSD